MRQARKRRFADGARVVCVAPASSFNGESGAVTGAEVVAGMQHFTLQLDLTGGRARFAEHELDPEVGDRRLNHGEVKVIGVLLSVAEVRIARLAEFAFDGVDEADVVLESWVRNALRRLVRYRWAVKVGPGAYKSSDGAHSLYMGGFAWGEVCERVKLRRQRAGLSQAALAEKLGVPRGWVAHREQRVLGKAIDPADVHRLAWALGCHPTSLARNNR